MTRTKFATAASALALVLAGCGASDRDDVALPGLDPAPETSEPEATATDSGDTASDMSEHEANTAALNAFFEDAFNANVARSPMTQTYLGIKTDYDKWDDASEARALEDMELARARIADMRERFSTAPLTPQAQMSYDLFEYQHAAAERSFAYRNHYYTFDQMNGEQSGIPAFLINQHQITSVSDAEAYIKRLRSMPDYMNQHIANAKASAELGIRPPLFAYDYVINDANNMLTENYDVDLDHPLIDDFFTKLDKLEADNPDIDINSTKLTKDAVAAVKGPVRKAYEELIAYVEADKANATADDGAWKLPEGGDYYAMRLQNMTTTEMSATEIHDLGLSEVARIHGEMRAIMQQVGFEGTLNEFFDDLRTNPKYFKPNTEEGKAEYLTEATAYIDTMRDALPDYFDTFPKAELVVKAVEPFREKSAGKAFYGRPAPDGSRPGTYYANLYNMADMPIYQMEALAYHEGIPGHHMQLAISQELEGIPMFRKFFRATAYTEGWGLYSEWLPKEMGFYTDPYSDFGRLAMELWRAARLVVDTGLHDKKWTRQEAIDYLITNTPNPEGDCIKAIERYIVMPGQATAYKIGMNKIIDLRQHAQAELGDDFDDGWFHDLVLEDGPMPLAMLETKVRAAVVERKG